MSTQLYIYASATVVFLLYIIRRRLKSIRRKNSIGIFHLYCSSGGGGERVLWHAVEALIRRYPKYTIYIYSHRSIGNSTLETLVKVKELFKIDLLSDQGLIEKLEFVPLSWSPIVEARFYPFATLFFQNLASFILALQAAYHVIPDIYIESIGFTFTLPVFKLLRCLVITYVHYPTISKDMIKDVKKSDTGSFNNREIYAKNHILRTLKLTYYRLIALTYGFAGRCADLVMVNSSWTKNHIDSLWGIKSHILYPPCDVESFKSRGAPVNGDQHLHIISIGQFRPEKNHNLQIEAFNSFLSKSNNYESTLTLYGGCRDAGDRKRVEQLRDLISLFELEANVDIVVDASFESLLAGVSKANVAIHTMKNEHFGIVLLECMAAGLITVAHNSGGPRADIIDDQKCGFLADDSDDFADKLLLISKMSLEQRQALRRNAIDKADRFSDVIFKNNFIKHVQLLRQE